MPENIVPYNLSIELFAAAPARPPLWPAYMGMLLADRTASGLAPVRNFTGTFDDKLVLVDLSNQGQPRGSAMPLLMDLARMPVFLHDDSVPSLSALLDKTGRSATGPPPFFVDSATEWAVVVAFLTSLDDRAL